MYAHSIRYHDLVARYIALSGRYHDLVARNIDLLYRYLDLVIRNIDLLGRYLDLMICCVIAYSGGLNVYLLIFSLDCSYTFH